MASLIIRTQTQMFTHTQKLFTVKVSGLVDIFMTFLCKSNSISDATSVLRMIVRPRRTNKSFWNIFPFTGNNVIVCCHDLCFLGCGFTSWTQQRR